MTENDYSIKPLPNLPNVTGLIPPKSGEDQKKRQPSKRSGRPPQSVEEEMTALNADDVAADNQDNEGRQHIDYRA